MKVLFGYSIGNFFHRYVLASRSCYFVHTDPPPTFCLVLVYLNAPRINGSRVFLWGSVLHSPNFVVCGVSNFVTSFSPRLKDALGFYSRSASWPSFLRFFHRQATWFLISVGIFRFKLGFPQLLISVRSLFVFKFC